MNKANVLFWNDVSNDVSKLRFGFILFEGQAK